MKAHSVTPAQHTATPVIPAAKSTATPIDCPPLGSPTFYVTNHGAITGRLFDLLYAHTDIRIIDVPDGGEFLHVDTALALADLIAADVELTTLIQQRELSGAA